MKFRLFFLLVTLTIPALVSAQTNNYIGYKYTGVTYNHKLPNGVTDKGGNLLDNENFGVSKMKTGKTEMLWLTRITGRNSDGVPRWMVKDVLVLPSLKKNQQILQGFSYPCTINGKDDLNLVVIADILKDKTFKARKVWRANTRTGKFQTVSARNVDCRYVEL